MVWGGPRTNWGMTEKRLEESGEREKKKKESKSTKEGEKKTQIL